MPLSQGLVALVDPADYPWLSQWKWSASRCHRQKFVAVRNERGRTVYMHRALLDLRHGDPREADHVNHDTLDNRRRNLRIITPKANKRYQPSRGGSSSRFVGVTWDASRDKWRAQIQVDGVAKNLGRFDSEMLAAEARDQYVLQHHTGHKLNLAPTI